MKRTIAVLLAALAALSLFAACSRGGKTPDAAALAESIAAQVLTEETVALSDTTLTRQYTALDASLVQAYGVLVCSSGASAQEVAVFRAADGADTAALQDALQARLDAQIARFENYVPAEMGKLGTAVITEKNGYFLFAVCDDPDLAEELFLAAF